MILPRKYPADFHQLEKVLRRQKPDRPVLFEYFVNGDLISYVNGEPFSTLNHPADQIKSIIGFFHRTGSQSAGRNINAIMLVISHFMFETYKRDITPHVIPVRAYPDTVRRILIDFAAKITTRLRNIILNVSKTVYQTINIELIWEKCQLPPKVRLT